MYAQVDKPKENKSRAFTDTVVQGESSGTQGFGFVDNRPKAITQKKSPALLSPPVQMVKIRAGKKGKDINTVEEMEDFIWQKGAYNQAVGKFGIEGVTENMKRHRERLVRIAKDLGGYLFLRKILKKIAESDGEIGGGDKKVGEVFQELFSRIETEIPGAAEAQPEAAAMGNAGAGPGADDDTLSGIFARLQREERKPILEDFMRHPTIKALGKVAAHIASFPSFYFVFSEFDPATFRSGLTEPQQFIAIANRWFEMEVNETRNLIAVTRIEEIVPVLVKMQKQLQKAEKEPEAWRPIAEKLLNLLQSTGIEEFTLPPDRATETREIHAESLYGYHVTYTHFLASIANTGLSAARRGGSTDTNTEDQQAGSDITSEDLNVFGREPSSLRPYILQFEGLRGMQVGSPEGLQPALIRFFIPATIGSGSQGIDFMQEDAVNTPLDIPAAFIEVLTGEGWIGIRDFVTIITNAKKNPGINLQELTPSSKSEGVVDPKKPPLILEGPELEKNAKELYNRLDAMERDGGIDAVITHLLGIRGQQVKLKFVGSSIFLGASMQSSASSFKKWRFSFQPTSAPEVEIRKLQWAVDAYNAEASKTAARDVADREIREEYFPGAKTKKGGKKK